MPAVFTLFCRSCGKGKRRQLGRPLVLGQRFPKSSAEVCQNAKEVRAIFIIVNHGSIGGLGVYSINKLDPL